MIFSHSLVFLGECHACRMSFCSPDKSCVIKTILHHGESDYHKFNYANLWMLDKNFCHEWKTDWRNQKCYEVIYTHHLIKYSYFLKKSVHILFIRKKCVTTMFSTVIYVFIFSNITRQRWWVMIATFTTTHCYHQKHDGCKDDWFLRSRKQLSHL